MTKELNFIKKTFLSMGRNSIRLIIRNSNLSDKEAEFMEARFIKGLTLKECADYFCLEPDTINKKQRKITTKLYTYLKNA